MPSALDIARSADGLSPKDPQKAGLLRDYLKTGGQNLNPAEYAWCAAFMNSSLSQAGYPGTNSNMARSFLDYGSEVPQGQQQPGDIAVFRRGSDPNLGHVGFYNGTTEDGRLRVYGGNQSNSVKESIFSPDQLLGFRRPQAAQPDAVVQGPPMPPAGFLARNGAPVGDTNTGNTGTTVAAAPLATQPNPDNAKFTGGLLQAFGAMGSDTDPGAGKDLSGKLADMASGPNGGAFGTAAKGLMGFLGGSQQAAPQGMTLRPAAEPDHRPDMSLLAALDPRRRAGFLGGMG